MQVSVQVIIKPAAEVEEPVTAANVHRLTPLPGVVRELDAYFRNQGFAVGNVVANTFAITASQRRFETAFGVRLSRDERGGLVVSEGNARELPLQRLPERIARHIQAIVFSEPPDFGPTSYS